jgi:hypothetical protein
MKHALQSLAAAAATALLVAGCGGRPGNDLVEDPGSVPSSATASTTAWVNFAKALVTSDTAEPLSLGGVTELPTSETEEPQALGA